jgi:hypothetical protein
VGGSKANPNDVQGQLAATRLKRQMLKREEKRIGAIKEAQTTDSNQ